MKVESEAISPDITLPYTDTQVRAASHKYILGTMYDYMYRCGHTWGSHYMCNQHTQSLLMNDIQGRESMQSQ